MRKQAARSAAFDRRPVFWAIAVGVLTIVVMALSLAGSTEDLVEAVAPSNAEAARASLQTAVVKVLLIAGLGLSGIMLLIGRLRRREAELERAMLTDSARELIAYVDREERYRFTNKPYRKWFGKSERQFRGATVREVLGESAYRTIGPKLEQARAGQAVAFETTLEQALGGAGVASEVDAGAGSTGAATAAARRTLDVLVTYTPDFDSDGTVRGVVVAVMETTHAKELEQYLDAILLNLPVGVAILEGPEFKVFRVNEALADLYGFPVEKKAGRPLVEILPEAAEPLLPVLRRILETGEPASVHESSITRPNDLEETLHLAEYLFPIMTPDGRLRAIGMVVVDFTERKKLESRNIQAQKMEAVGHLTGGIAHDFNNLLTGILGFGELAITSLDQDDPARDPVEEIVEAAERAANLTRQLLAFSRQQMLEPCVLDLNKVVAGFEKLIRQTIGEQIDVVCALDPDLGKVEADPGQIEQVLLNLALNARDAMQQGGRLTIKTANEELKEDHDEGLAVVVPGRYVMLAVSDTGHGLDEETRNRVFEPFFTTKPRGAGTGLGLSTVYGIVKQSGGYVWVYSAPGEGATFKIYFPRIEQTAETGPKVEDLAAPQGGPETVLLVEDEPLVRRLVERILERRGYRVLVAEQSVAALKLLEKRGRPVDLVVTDVVMPGCTGVELMKQVEQIHPGTRVLFISGYASESHFADLTSSRKVPFLKKPFTAEALSRRVREILDRSQPA